MTTEELAAAIAALPGLPPLERIAACNELIAACRRVLAAEKAAGMREAVEGGTGKAELARLLGVSESKVSRAIGEPSGEGRRGRPRASR